MCFYSVTSQVREVDYVTKLINQEEFSLPSNSWDDEGDGKGNIDINILISDRG